METSGSAREHVGGYVEKRVGELCKQKEQVARTLAQAGLSHFRDAVMLQVDTQIDSEKKRLEDNKNKLESKLGGNNIHAFKGKDLPGNKRIIGMHEHKSGISALDERELEHAIDTGNTERAEWVQDHELIHENNPGPEVYEQDPEILKKTLIALYEGWTEQKNRDGKTKMVLDAYPEERELLKNTVDRAGNTAHLEKALKEKDAFGARIILMHSLKHTRPDLLGGYDPTFEFMLYNEKRKNIQKIQAVS